MADFELSKWYLDCVTDAGDATLVYDGTLRWGPLRLQFASLLADAGGAIRVRNSLALHDEPALDDNSLRWASQALEASGEWTADAGAVHETVFRTGRGSVEWHCLMPRARVRLNDRTGLGYAERLVCTVPPWMLPLHTLRWGRFLCGGEWIVWIDWLGDSPRRIVYRNGDRVETAGIGDDSIEFRGGARLAFDRSRVLRSGRLGTHALAGLPGVRHTFPARLLEMDETKWRSRARLTGPGLPPVEGWAIHERVEWPTCS